MFGLNSRAEDIPMKFAWIAILFAAAALTASPSDTIAGTWKVKFDGPSERGPKTVGSIVLDLKIDGNTVTGLARIGTWPGDAPIADGRIDGNKVTFNATGSRGSTTGIPTCHFEATVDGDEMTLKMTAIKNPGGPLGEGVVYGYRGRKEPQ
jgi:hypothetical protein